MMAPKIQPITAFDNHLLAELHQRCFTAAWDRPWNAKSFSDILAMPGAMGAVISVNDAPVGFDLALQTDCELELLLLAVLPEARGQGLAYHLLTDLLAASQIRGVSRILLEVAQSNAAALACYSKAGFVSCGRRRDYYPGPIDALLLEKRFTQNSHLRETLGSGP